MAFAAKTKKPADRTPDTTTIPESRVPGDEETMRSRMRAPATALGGMIQTFNFRRLLPAAPPWIGLCAYGVPIKPINIAGMALLVGGMYLMGK